MSDNRDRGAEKLLAQNPGEPNKPAMKANADKILKLYNERDNLALRGINPHDYGDSIDLAKAKQQLADGLVAALPEKFTIEQALSNAFSMEEIDCHNAAIDQAEAAIRQYFLGDNHA